MIGRLGLTCLACGILGFLPAGALGQDFARGQVDGERAALEARRALWEAAAAGIGTGAAVGVLTMAHADGDSRLLAHVVWPLGGSFGMMVGLQRADDVGGPPADMLDGMHSGDYSDGFVSGWRSTERSGRRSAALMQGLSFLVAYGLAAGLMAL